MTSRATGLLMAVTLVSCGGATSQPTPTKLSEEHALVDPPARPVRTGRFSSPKLDAPGARTPQIDDAAVDATLAAAKQLIGAGTPAKAPALLHRCANKTPASARCDGELGIVLATLGTQKAHMRYFLAEAANNNDDKADAALYRRIAAAARKRGQHLARADALATLAARGEATAADYHEQGQALSADSARIGEAIEALQIAYDKDPTQHGWVLERGVLLAQINDWARAATTLQLYLDRAPAQAADRGRAQARLAMVKSQLAQASAPPK